MLKLHSICSAAGGGRFMALRQMNAQWKQGWSKAALAWLGSLNVREARTHEWAACWRGIGNEEVKAHFLRSWLRLRLLLPSASANKRLLMFDLAVRKKENPQVSHHVANTGFQKCKCICSVYIFFFFLSVRTWCAELQVLCSECPLTPEGVALGVQDQRGSVVIIEASGRFG